MEYSTLPAAQQGTAAAPHRVTFRVANHAANRPAPHELTDPLKSLRQLEAFTEEIGKRGELLRHSLPPHSTAEPTMSLSHGLVSGLISAYSRHYNIELRPDDFWSAVLVQFSFYLNANAEELRSRFVDFQGKRKLIVYMDGHIRTVDHAVFIRKMIPQIASNLKDPSIRDWVIPSFTTTTPNDALVFSVVLMSALKSYFSYKMVLECGIPNVTLCGTPADYEDLARRVDRLLEFDNAQGHMKKWHSLLRPIFDELIRASRGQHSVDFWSRVCTHYGGGSGPSYISGWVSAFCCFDDHGEWQGDNYTYEWEQYNFDTQRTTKHVVQCDWPVIDDDNIPPGHCCVPVNVDDHGVKYETHIVGGSLVANVVNGDTVVPRLDWFMAIDDPKKKK